MSENVTEEVETTERPTDEPATAVVEVGSIEAVESGREGADESASEASEACS